MTPNIDKIVEHYNHARKKHPYFCDRITLLPKTSVDTHVRLKRSLLEAEIFGGTVEAVAVVECELLEAVQAFMDRKDAHAIGKAYDCIAVLLRLIDVLEGRQELGSAETKGVDK